MDIIKVEVIARETIKPSSPTPHHLKTYKLSLMDQYNTQRLVPLVFFYTSTGTSTTTTNHHFTRISQHLKKSLSKTLNLFYPFAGRLRPDNFSIDCNDQGVDFLEARVRNCCLFDILKQPKLEDIAKYLVPNLPTDDFYSAPLLIIQASFFPCGGISICVALSHKIADGVSFTTFMKSWSCVALGSPTTVVPNFDEARSRFPPREYIKPTSMKFQQIDEKVVTKRFVVDASKAAALKAKAVSSSMNNKQPTRVEAVIALVWKCAMVASKSRLKSSSTSCQNPPRWYELKGGVNLRAKHLPPFPEHSVGNITGMSWAMMDSDEINETTELSELVHRLRKGVEDSTDSNLTKKIAKLKQLKGDNTELYYHTSLCRFGFYDVDFGWGKPTWFIGTQLSHVVGFILTDTRDGAGVEVYVTLAEEDMSLFERDQDLMAFASYNRSAL